MDWDPTELLALAGSAVRSVPMVLSQPRVGGIVGGLLAGILVASGLHWHYRRRAKVLPHIPSLSEALDGAHDETTRLLSAVHEMTMSVTNAWNVTRSRRGSR